MKVPKDIMRRVKALVPPEKNLIDIEAILDKTPEQIQIWIEDFERDRAKKQGPESLRQCELMIEQRRNQLTEMREREVMFEYLEAQGITAKDWFDNQVEVEALYHKFIETGEIP